MDEAFRTVFGPTPKSGRPNPASGADASELNPQECDLSARLMRINHAGEICAQALYQGQAVAAERPNVREKMQQAANEENDHLNWTSERIRELGGHTSYLNPLWYSGSFAIGVLAGLCGDRWSLGFIAETERQVVRHLEQHLSRLPSGDHKSRAILERMCADEGHHATVAIESGAAELPEPIRRIMRQTSKIMTQTAYWI